MKIYRLLPVAALALLAGCSGDNVSTFITPDPHAAVRWVNAVPDTIDMDYRIVDIVTNANEASVKYRGTSGGYRGVPPGTHRIRVFPSGTTTAARPWTFSSDFTCWTKLSCLFDVVVQKSGRL